VPEPFSSISLLDMGEAEAVYYAWEEGSFLLMDEAAGRSVARAHGVTARGTIYVLVNAVKEGLISCEDARVDILTLVENRFRVSARVLKRILREIERLEG
jgi:predicted nucleic acid-binding protein